MMNYETQPRGEVVTPLTTMQKSPTSELATETSTTATQQTAASIRANTKDGNCMKYVAIDIDMDCICNNSSNSHSNSSSNSNSNSYLNEITSLRVKKRSVTSNQADHHQQSNENQHQTQSLTYNYQRTDAFGNISNCKSINNNNYNNNNQNNNNKSKLQKSSLLLFEQERRQHQQQEQRKLLSITLFQIIFLTIIICLVISAISYIWYKMSWMWGLPALLIALMVLLLTKPGWRWFYIASVTSKRDLIALIAYIKLLLLMRKLQRQNLTVADVFQQHVAKHPDKVAICSGQQSWTFNELNDFSNRLANLFYSHGYKKGDVVALLLENRPEYVGIWLGLSKLGCITALINTNLRGPSLLHSITVSNCLAVIYGENFLEAMENITDEIPSQVSLYQLNDNDNVNHNDNSDTSKSKKLNGMIKDLATLVQTSSNDVLPQNVEKCSHHHKLLYIYTSGTTGLPKAAVITNSRYIFIAAGIHFTLDFHPNDIFYTPLPLYHTAGGVMSIGQALLFGSTVAIRKKFSASGYFADCVKFNATIGQYIGEMARYILATAPSSNDHKHNVRMIFGNGLRPQIWPQFVKRFNISKVGEFYGATEGNANIMNNDNTVGAIGFVSRILPQVYPISIIRANPDTGEPIRNPNGLCQICKPNEPGVFIGKIVRGNPAREFLGYVDANASAKKIVRDVFKKGDMAFLSGDLLVADEKGYLYFKDRTGDTFRWKGENVSTSEVEAQVSNVAGYKDTIVYGVTVPHSEGRAGMAAIFDPERTVNLHNFEENITKVLPVYARPQFLRFLTKIDLTGTFKLRKVDLQKEGYDPNIINDPLYYRTVHGKYEPLTREIYDMIERNELRF